MTYLLVGTGARRGEACALRRTDINTENYTVRIKSSVVRRRYGELLVSSTKTGDERTISVEPEVIDAMMAWKKEQSDLFGAISFDGFCFAVTDAYTPPDPDSVTKYYDRLSKRNHFAQHVNPHAFRHSQASIILKDGDIVMASKRLGHSKTSTTLDIYGHMMPTTDREASKRVGEAFFKGLKPNHSLIR